MATGAPLNHVIREVYPVRIVAYYSAIVILVSKMWATNFQPWNLALLAYILLHPHLLHFICGSYWNKPRGARFSMLCDGCLLGLMIVAAEFSLMPSVAFLSGLVAGTLVIARPVYLIGNLSMFVLSTGLSAFLIFPNINNEGWVLTNGLSALFIIGYGGLIASLSYVETTELDIRRRAMTRDKSVLQATYNRLRPYVSPQLVSSLEFVKEITTLRKPMSIFFSDIEGFTNMMDKYSEDLMTRVLNEYLNEMTEVACSYGGTVDKFVGDGIMIMFGAPESRGLEQDAINCVAMALVMRSRLECLRQKWANEGIPGELHVRMGIHSGYCAVGNFGSNERMDYTAIGGVVNLANRLESAAERNEILISKETWQLVHRGFTGMQKPSIRVKGIAREVSIVSLSGFRNVEKEVSVAVSARGERLFSTG
ncbi:MAG: adenylate/guanylate cyclase domain-containing protein [Pseudomonadales bacterium]|jgi:class 3 adenylate cyclase